MAVGIEAVVVDDQTVPGGGVLRVERIRILEPGAREADVEVQGVAGEIW